MGLFGQGSKYGRKRFYVVRCGLKTVSRHYKLSTAKKKVNALYRQGKTCRVYDQDGRAYY